MNIKTKVRKIGNSLGIILPREALNVLKVEEGASLYVTETPKSAIRLTPEDEYLSQMMEIARKGMSKYRNTLRELAK